jgi:hypothetical protein
MVYPILMLVHMFVLKDEQRHKLFQWQHSQLMIYIFFGIWAVVDVYFIYRFFQLLFLPANLFKSILPAGAAAFFQVVACLSGFFLFQRNRMEALEQ